MAKKLIHKYTFTPASNTLVIPEIIKQSRFVLITNMTDGITIFTFNSQTAGFTTYTVDTTAKTTTLVLDKDCSAMSSTDDLQIFIEEDKVSIAPDETYSDPVSKLRVSNPENLIDTDFEYGLQPSKWETLELVKNVPTFFNRDGDTGLEITSVTTTNGSVEVQVVLSSEHGFSPGAPIIVKSTSSNSCNGAFVVTATPSTTTFSYKAKSTQTFTGTISDTYTEIYYGSVYQGTEFKLSGLDAITTDNATPSTLTVSTDSPTDFKEGTSFFLTNSLGTQNLTFDATAVNTSLSTSTTKTFAIAADNTLSGRRRTNGFQTYAWQAKESKLFLPSEVTIDSSNNQITINNHTLIDGQAYLWSSGIGNMFGNIAATNNGNGTVNTHREKIFYVRTVDANIFYLSETFNSTSRVSITSNTIVDGGLYKLELMPAYGMKNYNSTAFWFSFSGNWDGSQDYGGAYGSQKRNVNLPPEYMFASASGKNGIGDFTATSGYVTPGTGDERFWVRWWSDGDHSVTYAQADRADTEPMHKHATSIPRRPWLVTALAMRYFYANTGSYYSHTQAGFNNFADLTDTTHRYSSSGNTYDVNATHSKGIFMIPVTFNDDYGKFYQPNHGLTNHQAYVVTSNANTYTDQTTSASVDVKANFNVTASGGTTGNGGTNTSNAANNVYKIMTPDTNGFYLGYNYQSSDSFQIPTGNQSLGSNFTLKPYWTRSNQAIATSVSDVQFKTSDEDSFKLSMPSNTLTDSDPLVYDDAGNTTIGGLTDDTTYYAATTTSSQIRLADQVQGVYPWGYNPANGTTDTNGATVYQVYSNTDTSHDGGYDRIRLGGTGFLETGDLVQYIERNGQIAGLINGAFYYYRRYGLTNATYCNLFYDKALATRDYSSAPLTGFDQYRPYGRIHLPNNATYSSPNYRGEFRKTSIKELTSVGSGTQNLQNTSVGGSDGVYKVTGVTDNKTYSMAATGQLPSRTFTVVSKTHVDLNRNAINYPNHGFTTGSSFTVNNTNIGGLATGTTYHAINVGKDWFKVATSAENAEQNSIHNLTTVSTNSTSFTSTSLAGQSVGDGTVNCESGSVRVTGVATNFPSKYTVGDNFKINVTKTLTAKACSGLTTNTFASNGHSLSDGDALIVNCTSAPSNLVNGHIVYAGGTSNANSFTVHLTAADAIAGSNVVTTSGGSGLSFNQLTTIDSYEEGIIKYVNNITSLELASGASQTLTDANYMIETSLLVRADGFAVHRPYDGGVELIPSTNPDSQMIRQTRKYFRYQSGKGIQNSLAINFSPTTDIDTFSATGNVGTVTTRNAHRLSSGLNVTVKGATVSGGVNTYNNSFRILSVPTENSFTVAFDTTLTLSANVTVGEGETITQTNSGTTGVVRSAVANSNTVQLHTVRSALSDVNVAVTVTNPSGSQNLYTFDGSAAPANYAMAEGRKYIFNQNDASNVGHPMRIAESVDGTSFHGASVYKLDGSVVSYSDWSNATTFNAATTRILEVTFSAYSSDYYYACHFHSNMGNSISTPTASTGTFTTTAADVLTADITGALSAYPASIVNAPSDTIANSILGFTVDSWTNSVLRAGLFDDQNGLFWEYDGSTLACIVRSSTQQLSGFVAATFKSTLITGTNTKFATQLNVSDRIIVKGQTYRVTSVNSDTSLNVIPSYRGVSGNNIIATKTVDNKVTQDNWNLDKCDGTGPTSFVLDKTKIHMTYIDYSWYGAGKVRFGFKNQNGDVMYIHQFIHNNLRTEAYMRSGNIPGRYEIENTGIPSYVPALAHWGTSVIMDGRFDNDKAYVFTAAGNNMTITGSEQLVVSGKFESTSAYYIRHSNYKYYYAGYGLTVATPNNEYNSIVSNVGFTGTNAGSNNITRNPSTYLLTPVAPYQAGARVSTSYTGSSNSVKNLILVQNQPTGVDGSNTNYTFTLSTAGSTSVTEPIPLISIRLAPSVDNGTPGLLGEREIINRMQLAMKQVGILSTHAAEIEIKLNGNIDNNDWQRVTVPSLSQLVYHSATDTLTGGNTIYSFRAQGGTGTSGRTAVTTTQDLSEISDLGNSILGGDNVFPDGPDVVTIIARLVEDPSTVSSSNPFQISGRVSWAESQA